MEKYVTRYTIEYYPGVDDDEDRLTDYVFADTHEEAMAVFKESHGEACVVTMCEPIEVPARYKKWDEEAVVQTNRKTVDMLLHDADGRCGLVGSDGRNAVEFVKD